ncbi:hypothetical protein KH5H1_27820 [Corallococcus caeni]|nr:hypothetical protein KH5H1_27820 [Corallococcus sp. KH5-1]
MPTFANGNLGQLQLGGKEQTGEAEVSALRPSLLAVSKVFHADPAELTFQRVVTDGLDDRHFVDVRPLNQILTVRRLCGISVWGGDERTCGPLPEFLSRGEAP